jgi:CheY-like chemotaxis protein
MRWKHPSLPERPTLARAGVQKIQLLAEQHGAWHRAHYRSGCHMKCKARSGKHPAVGCTEHGALVGGRSNPPSTGRLALRRKRDDEPAAPIRLLLVEDHALFRQALAWMLRQEPDLLVVGEASNGATALDQIPTLHPEIVLMDVRMPIMNGIEAARLIHARFPEVRVIGVSITEDRTAGKNMRQSGAVAFLSKGASPDALFKLIRRHARLGRAKRSLA